VQAPFWRLCLGLMEACLRAGPCLLECVAIVWCPYALNYTGLVCDAHGLQAPGLEDGPSLPYDVCSCTIAHAGCIVIAVVYHHVQHLQYTLRFLN
jgi:hypothetical protein